MVEGLRLSTMMSGVCPRLRDDGRESRASTGGCDAASETTGSRE